MSETVRDRRTARWCWQDRAALDRIRAGLGPTNEVTSGIAIYVSLTARANSAEQCWPKMDVIATDAGVGIATARRRIGDLEKLELITVEACIGPDGDTSNTYTLIDPPETPPAADWRAKPPPVRPLSNIASAPRVVAAALRPAQPKRSQTTTKPVEPDHHDRAATRTDTGQPDHHDRPRPIITSGPADHHEGAGPLTMIGSLNGVNDLKINDLNRTRESPRLFERTDPGLVISPPGVSAASLWAAMLEDVRSTVPAAAIAQLRPCRLAGDAAHLVVIAPAGAVTPQLRRHQVELERAARLIVSDSTRLTFYAAG